MAAMYYIDLNCKQQTGDNAGCIVLAPADTGKVEPASPRLYHIAGIRPEQLLKATAKELERNFIRQLNSLGPIALGPAGIDRQLNISMQIQWEVFELQAWLAAEMQIPLLLQAKELLPELLQLHQTLGNRSEWIIQDFSGKASDAVAWTQQGGYLSMGTALFHFETVVGEALANTPLSQLFLETANNERTIVDVYQAATDRLAIETGKLQEIIYKNFNKVFGRHTSKP